MAPAGQHAVSRSARRPAPPIDELALPFTVPAGTACIGISVGAALARRGDDAERAIGRADLAMYEAKQAGKGRLVLAPPSATPLVGPALAVAS